MNKTLVTSGSDRLILLIKSAYWIALLLIAAMATAAYILLQQVISAHQRDQEVIQLIAAQKTLSQRVIFLANAVSGAIRPNQPVLVVALRDSTGQFEHNYDQLLELTVPTPDTAQVGVSAGWNDIFYGAPHHLDYFSISLIANGKRLVSYYETELGLSQPGRGYMAGMEKANLDESIARATLEGYNALGATISAINVERMSGLLDLHRKLFFATLVLIVLVAIFIFRPMAELMRRKTRELVEARNSMAFIATHDGLTGLHNRSFLNDHFDTLVTSAEKRGQRLAVIQFDLDRFKQINDTLGHAAGDHVLAETARRMNETSRASDVCIRLGGDEFVVILNGIGSDDEIGNVVRRTLDHINKPISFQRSVIMPGASAGVAVFPDNGRNSADLLVHADLALYSTKKQGGGGYSFFSEGLRRELEYRKQIEQDLRVAIAERNFEVQFQPQISMNSGAVTGIEALTRWNHPELGRVSPGDFIPIAEQSGLMAAIGRIILTQAVETAAGWHKSRIAFGRLAVNVSGAELREDDFSDFLFATLDHYDFPREKLSLEIVESVILDDEKTDTAAKLRHIRASGIHLELDDFGTGYASLTHISPSEIDRLKIDRRFVHNIDSRDENRKIVRAICDLANSLGLSIVAEGAETQAELTALASIGCDEVQGYHIAYPMTGSATKEWLESRASTHDVKRTVSIGV
ncbi:EAL domain-containing protein [Corticibacterium sp. UT-5YL-CI-8]|nr:EAL domain-containing protein [Tianweitania sp. UT-5YL-CI-8]